MTFPAFLGKILQHPDRIKPRTTIFPYECLPAVIWNFQNAIYRRCRNIRRIITLTFGSEGRGAQPPPPFFHFYKVGGASAPLPSPVPPPMLARKMAAAKNTSALLVEYLFCDTVYLKKVEESINVLEEEFGAGLGNGMTRSKSGGPPRSFQTNTPLEPCVIYLKHHNRISVTKIIKISLIRKKAF